MNLRHAFRQWRKTRGESGGDGRNRNAAAFQRPDRGFDEGVVDADGAGVEIQLLNPQGFHHALLQRLAGLGAQAADAVGGVVAGERRQVHAGDGAQQPRRLPLFLHGAPRANRAGAPLHRAGIGANLLNPLKIERHAAIRRQRPAVEFDRNGMGQGWVLLLLFHCHSASPPKALALKNPAVSVCFDSAMLLDLKANKGARVRFLPAGQGPEQCAGMLALPFALLGWLYSTRPSIPLLRCRECDLPAALTQIKMIGGKRAFAPVSQSSGLPQPSLLPRRPPRPSRGRRRCARNFMNLPPWISMTTPASPRSSIARASPTGRAIRSE